MQPNIIKFESGFEAFWIGDPSAKYVFIYFHGKCPSLPLAVSIVFTVLQEADMLWMEIHII